MMKRISILAVLALGLALVLAVSACAPAAAPEAPVEPEAPAQEGIYTPGTYTGKGKGFGGDVEVTITVDANAITDVKIVGDSETAGIGSNAVEQMPELILTAQSAEVEAVSGATLTSSGILEALTLALTDAKA